MIPTPVKGHKTSLNVFLNIVMSHDVIYVQRKGFQYVMGYLFFNLFLLETKVLILYRNKSFPFVIPLCYFCLVLLFFHARLFVDALWSPAGKGLTS